MDMTRVVRIHRFGGPDVLEVEDLPMPQPQDDEVVVRSPRSKRQSRRLQDQVRRISNGERG